MSCLTISSYVSLVSIALMVASISAFVKPWASFWMLFVSSSFSWSPEMPTTSLLVLEPLVISIPADRVPLPQFGIELVTVA